MSRAESQCLVGATQVCKTDADVQRAQAAWAAYGASTLDPGSVYKPETLQRSITSFFAPKVPRPGVLAGNRQGPRQDPGPCDTPGPKEAPKNGAVSSVIAPGADEKGEGVKNSTASALNGPSGGTGTLAGTGTSVVERLGAAATGSNAIGCSSPGKPVVNALATLMREGQRAYHARSTGHESPSSKAAGSGPFFSFLTA